MFCFIIVLFIAQNNAIGASCNKGFYNENGVCKKCPQYWTTEGPGATSASACNKPIGYAYGTTSKWNWPETVKPGAINAFRSVGVGN